MSETEKLYLQYYTSISAKMMLPVSPFGVMTEKIVKQFNDMGLTNEEKAGALVAVYTEECKSINAQASAAALELLKQEDSTELNDAKVDTEVRKVRGYDDNLYVELMKAQSGLASFAVNANSSTAQDTIDDLHEIMDKVSDRICGFNCGDTSLIIDETTDITTTIDGHVYGGTGPVYSIIEVPLMGTLTVDQDGAYRYVPVNDISGVGVFTGIISGVDADSGFTITTTINITVTEVP